MTTPLFNPLLIPEGTRERPNTIAITFGDNPVFNFDTGEFYLNPDGTFIIKDDKEGLVNLIRKRLVTRRHFFPIYTVIYGSDLFHLIGKNLTTAEKRLEVKRMILSSLKNERRIRRVRDFVIDVGRDYITVEFAYDDVWGSSQRVEVIY